MTKILKRNLKVTLCDLQWPLKSNFIIWKLFFLIKLAFIENFLKTRFKQKEISNKRKFLKIKLILCNIQWPCVFITIEFIESTYGVFWWTVKEHTFSIMNILTVQSISCYVSTPSLLCWIKLIFWSSHSQRKIGY